MKPVKRQRDHEVPESGMSQRQLGMRKGLIWGQEDAG